MKKVFIPLILLSLIVLSFFSPFFLSGKLPVPADTIIGLYHPFRDLYAKDYPRGIPFKNSLITDPVRQQYPWRELAFSMIKKLELPLWNPYSLSGTPLLANFQTAAFYPLNIVFFVLPFSISWGFLIILGPLLAGIFLYFYLLNLKINRWSALFGALSFSFSGFITAWMEWGTVTNTALWLPLILLSIDKIFFSFKSFGNSKFKNQNSKLQLKNQKLFIWSFVLVISLITSFFAGHLQIFFYLFLLSIIYFFVRWVQHGKNKQILLIYLILNTCFLILTSIQWFPVFQFILQSARDVDQVAWQQEGWFIPWQHLIQLIVPDFFGNPSTLNYWGVWNYGEFISYIGIIPIIFSIFALFFRRDRKTFFWGTVFFMSLIFSLPTFFASLPYSLKIPFLSTAQPTRFIFLIDFSLCVLAALGFDYFLKYKKQIFYPLVFAMVILTGFWLFVFRRGFELTSMSNIAVTKNNLLLPTALLVTFFVFVTILIKFENKKLRITFILLIFLLTVFDLQRFSSKFNPFTKKEYLFPDTKTISFLQKQSGNFRIMSIDPAILPPNFSVVYRLQTIDGYDPLYLRRYGELIAASERGKPDINPPFGFNRIINPKNFDSKIIDLLGVKYILSLSDINSTKLKKIFQEGETRIYENNYQFPRAFFVKNVYYRGVKEEAIELVFNDNFDLKQEAVIESLEPKDVNFLNKYSVGQVKITDYSENRIRIKTENNGEGFLILTDSFYPSWHAKIDGNRTEIFRANYNFRGIVVPKGKHDIEFYISLF